MMKRQNLRILRPGQWAMVKVPNWLREKSYELDREVIVVGLIARHRPNDNCECGWDWFYSVCFRHARSHLEGCYYSHEQYQEKESGHYRYLHPHDFDMIDVTWDNRVGFDQKEAEAYRLGRGAFLYEPMDEAPEKLRPGGDWSIYTCDKCSRTTRAPWSNDAGELICPHCEVTGLVVADNALELLEEAREAATKLGCREKFERDIDLFDTWRVGAQTRLSNDFSHLSFNFSVYMFPNAPSENARHVFNGGLIFHGPSQPGDGSAPAFSVDLGWATGQTTGQSYWSIHT